MDREDFKQFIKKNKDVLLRWAKGYVLMVSHDDGGSWKETEVLYINNTVRYSNKMTQKKFFPALEISPSGYGALHIIDENDPQQECLSEPNGALIPLHNWRHNPTPEFIRAIPKDEYYKGSAGINAIIHNIPFVSVDIFDNERIHFPDNYPGLTLDFGSIKSTRKPNWVYVATQTLHFVNTKTNETATGVAVYPKANDDRNIIPKFEDIAQVWEEFKRSKPQSLGYMDWVVGSLWHDEKETAIPTVRGVTDIFPSNTDMIKFKIIRGEQ